MYSQQLSFLLNGSEIFQTVYYEQTCGVATNGNLQTITILCFAFSMINLSLIGCFILISTMKLIVFISNSDVLEIKLYFESILELTGYFFLKICSQKT